MHLLVPAADLLPVPPSKGEQTKFRKINEIIIGIIILFRKINEIIIGVGAATPRGISLYVNSKK